MEGHKFTFNGKDISESGKWMADSYMKQDFGKMGWIFAHAMDEELAPAPTPGPGPKPDPKPCPFLEHAAHFAQGFLKGAKVGEFESKDLYECLMKEKKADKIFEEVEKEWKYAIEKKDIKMGIKGLDESVGFILDMAMEHDEKK